MIPDIILNKIGWYKWKITIKAVNDEYHEKYYEYYYDNDYSESDSFIGLECASGCIINFRYFPIHFNNFSIKNLITGNTYKKEGKYQYTPLKYWYSSGMYNLNGYKGKLILNFQGRLIINSNTCNSTFSFACFDMITNFIIMRQFRGIDKCNIINNRSLFIIFLSY